MRLALMVATYGPAFGGTERLCAQVARELTARGHSTCIVTSDVGSSHPRGIFHIDPLPAGPGEVDGVALIRLPYAAALTRHAWWATGPIPGRNHLRGWLRARAKRGYIRAAMAFAKAWQPDVLITMRAWDLPTEAGAQMRESLGTPVVYSPQMHPETDGWREAPVRDLVTRCDALSANTRYEADLLVARYAAPRDRIVVTGCGVTPAAHPGPWPRPPNVLYFGRKSLQKGLGLLIDAMRQVWAQRPDARLILAGAAHNRDAPSLAARIAQLPAEQRVRIEQRENVSDDERDRLMATANCLCLPSEHESFGIVLLEAWTQGTPIVTLDLPVMRELVSPDVDGLLSQRGDATDLARQLLRLLQDTALAQALGAAGAAKVRRQHTWSAVATRYEEVAALACRLAAHRVAGPARTR